MKKEYKEIFPAIRVGNSTNNLAGRIAFLSVAFFCIITIIFYTILLYEDKMKILSYSLCGAGAGFLFAILSYFIELSLIEIYIFIDKEGISKGSKYGKKALFISWDDIEMIKTKEICLTENWSAKVVRFVKYGLLLYRKKEEKIKVICISSKHIRLIDTNDCKSIFNSKSSIVLRYTEERLALLKRYLPNT